jgi:abortive infection bacteriophage resistance protein
LKKQKVHYSVFESWLHTLTYVRNICAHHGRLWNKEFAVEPKKLKSPAAPWVMDLYTLNNKRSFYFLCLLKYLLNIINPPNRLKEKLLALFEKYPQVPIRYMGIPHDKDGKVLNWANEALWKVVPN